MTGFFLKKSFFDGWDNIIQILLLNVVFILAGFAVFFLGGLASANNTVLAVVIIAGSMAIGVLALGVSSVMYRIADFRAFTLKDLIDAIGKTWKHGMLYALVGGGLFFLLRIAGDYYRKLGTPGGFGMYLAVLWITVICTLSIQWFLPIRTQLDGGFFKTLKKCFIIFLDNPGLSIFLFFYQLVLAILSVVGIGLLPGVAGIILAQNNAFRLLMYKYDWLETQSEEDYLKARKNVPWDELIGEDFESLGSRTFRNFVFPWKH